MFDLGDDYRVNEFPRISERYECTGIYHEWQLTIQSRSWRKKSASRWVSVEVRDITVAGARVAGPVDEQLRRGAKVPFRYEGESGVAEIRHAVLTSNPEIAVYGVLFLRVSDGLERQIFDQVASLRKNPAALNDAWSRAR